MSPSPTEQRLQTIAREIRQSTGVELLPFEVALPVATAEESGRCRIVPSLEGLLRTWYGRRASSVLKKCFDDEGTLNLDFVQDLAEYTKAQISATFPSTEDLMKLPRVAAIL